MGDSKYENNFSPESLGYIFMHRAEIVNASFELNVPVLGVAGSIAREITNTSAVYSKEYLARSVDFLQFKEYLTQKNETHETIAKEYELAKQLPDDVTMNPSYAQRLDICA